MNRRISLITMALVLISGSLYAQTSGSVPLRSNTQMMKDIKGTVHEIDLEKKVIIIEDDKEQLVQFTLDRRIKLKADRKSPLGGKKKLELADIEKELLIKVSYRQDEPSKAVELRVLEQPAASASDS